MRGILVAAMACGWASGVAAPVPKDKAKAAKDEAALLGTWRVDSIEIDGMPPPADLRELTLTFKDGTMEVHMRGQRVAALEYRLDPTAKPKAFDLLAQDKVLAPGIYELDGDALKICLADGGQEPRPTGFDDKSAKVARIDLARVRGAKTDK